MKNFKLFLTLLMVAVLGCGEMWGAGAYNLATYTFDSGTTMPTNVSNHGGSSFATNRFCFDGQDDYIIITPTIPDGATTLYIQVKGLMNNSGNEQATTGTIGIYGLTSTNGAVSGASGTFSQSQGAMTNIQSVDNGVVDETEISFPAKGVAKIKINEDAHNKKYVIKSVTITYDACSNSVSLSAGTSTNASLTLGKTSIETCSATNADREVEITVSPSPCYTLPSSTRLDFSGVSATYVSGPTNNKFVYRFAQNANGNSTVTVSLSTKTTYTVSYNKGTYGSGENGSGTKTCGETLTLPSSAMFEREGYTQTGWSTVAAGNEKNYELGGNYTANAGTTLYPYWEANDCAITWMVNGEEWKNKGGSTTAKYDGKVANLPTAPNTTTEGCGDKFMGWTKVNIGENVLNKDVPADATTIGTLNYFTDVDGSPVIQGATTFYAVFAEYVEK